MQNAFILNPNLNKFNSQDAIFQRITQVRSIVNCLLIANEEVDYFTRYGVLWSIDCLLEDLNTLEASIAFITPILFSLH